MVKAKLGRCSLVSNSIHYSLFLGDPPSYVNNSCYWRPICDVLFTNFARKNFCQASTNFQKKDRLQFANGLFIFKIIVSIRHFCQISFFYQFHTVGLLTLSGFASPPINKALVMHYVVEALKISRSSFRANWGTSLWFGIFHFLFCSNWSTPCERLTHVFHHHSPHTAPVCILSLFSCILKRISNTIA